MSCFSPSSLSPTHSHPPTPPKLPLTRSIHPSTHPPTHSILHSTNTLMHSSSWRERTARAALSTVCRATAVPPRTPHHFTPHRPCPTRRRPHPPQSSRCLASLSRTFRQTAPLPRNQTPSKSGPNPGACMKVGVSNMGFWWRVLGELGLWGAAGSFGKVERRVGDE